jgi:broad specificity phosphatase PhoE
MISIYLLRHGESEMNLRLAELVSGRSNHTPLTPLGYSQARNAGKWLATQGIIPTIAIASPALRTRETMRTCLEAMRLRLPIEIEDDLQEITHGEMEGKSRPWVWNDERKAALRKDPLNYALPGGESIRDVQARKSSWLARIGQHHADGSVILVAGHGIAIRSLVGHLHDWDYSEIVLNTSTPNCSLTHIVYDGEHFQVEYLGRDIVAEVAQMVE